MIEKGQVFYDKMLKGPAGLGDELKGPAWLEDDKEVYKVRLGF